MPSELRTGDIVAGFRVTSLIGQGAVGSVYLAEDTRNGNRFALKLLGDEVAQDERFRQRFLRESELAASLDHPHVVPTLASGEDDGRLYLAMEYVEGSDLRDVLQREGSLQPSRAIDLVGQVSGSARRGARGRTRPPRRKAREPPRRPGATTQSTCTSATSDSHATSRR